MLSFFLYFFCVSFSCERKYERIERKFKMQNPNFSLAWTFLLEKRSYIWPSFTRLQSRSYWAYYKTQCGPESMFKFKNSKSRYKIFLGYVCSMIESLVWILLWLFLRKYWCICHFLKHISKPFIFLNLKVWIFARFKALLASQPWPSCPYKPEDILNF